MEQLSQGELDRLVWLAGRPTQRVQDLSDLRLLVRKGLLSACSDAERLAASATLAQLKAQAKQRGVTVGGRKAEVAVRIADRLTDAERQTLRAEVVMFVPTEAGRLLIDAHRASLEREREQREQRILAHLVAGRVTDAAKERDLHTNRLARSRGEEREEFLLPSVAYVDRVTQVLALDYNDLILPDETRRRVAAAIAFGELAGDASLAVRLVMGVTGNVLPCPSLVRWLREDVCGGYAVGFAPDDETGEDQDPWSLATLYCHTKAFEASNTATLLDCMSRRWGLGIRILRGGDCQLCSEGPDCFRWDQLADLPKLPQHWGCRCLYGSWSEWDAKSASRDR